ncbi:tetratricopeptide repeat protein [Streptomyces sp. NPDC052040]|uniref:tetratricopeptide repeat protein n=1 Tax=unclassified Streptomyces TaxID=2593676 RepID=UPI0037CD7EB8
MEIEQQDVRRSRRSPALRTALVGTVAGCAVLGGTTAAVLLTGQERTVPAPAAVARARTAVAAGVPAALPELTALVADREARLRNRPRDGRAWAVLGAAYVAEGARTADTRSFPRAEEALRASLRVSGWQNSEALAGLAALANARGDHRAARRWGERAVRSAPGVWTMYPPLVEAYEGLGREPAARLALDRLLALNRGPAAMALAARVYGEQGRFEDAAALLADAAARAAGPAEQAAYAEEAGELAWAQGDPVTALRYAEGALRLDPERCTALAGRGRALAALGRAEEAVESYRKALALHPAPGIALELGELYESLGRAKEAGRTYALTREWVRRDRADGVHGALVRGLLEADHGDPRRAVRVLRREWRRQPGARAADALGWALHRAGEDEEALRFAVRATDPAHGDRTRAALFAYHRGEIERSLGRTGPARRHLAEALRINPYFSPLLARAARSALGELGDPPVDEGPDDVAASPRP